MKLESKHDTLIQENYFENFVCKMPAIFPGLHVLIESFAVQICNVVQMFMYHTMGMYFPVGIILDRRSSYEVQE